MNKCMNEKKEFVYFKFIFRQLKKAKNIYQ